MDGMCICMCVCVCVCRMGEWCPVGPVICFTSHSLEVQTLSTDFSKSDMDKAQAFLRTSCTPRGQTEARTLISVPRMLCVGPAVL